MATVIAYQKRSTDFGKVLDTPCRFDPLDGNANEWFHHFEDGSGSWYPCVGPTIYIFVKVASSTEFDPGSLQLEDWDGNTESLAFSQSTGWQHYGSYFDGELSTLRTDRWFDYDVLQMRVPVWAKNTKALRGSILCTTDSLRFAAGNAAGFSDNTLPWGGNFFDDSWTFAETYGYIDFEVLLAESGRVYRV